ncbi:hypothetical protein BV22DRAFT_1134113 [Leucogyrophana mollusca]|uniref:Uncharacterized protein n=1 Tax=Leucogyrophana mollusca TaxID=85980 RepID=A0ACB8B082_9AGAM|nr:hypothetical protein BV22DRAFT_1134113 [Leucogyrophana mollusca]
MPLDKGRLEISDDARIRCNAEAWSQIDESWTNGEIELALDRDVRDMLQLTVTAWKPFLDQKYETVKGAKGLLREYPELYEEVRHAFKTRELEGLVSCTILWPPKTEVIGGQKNSPSSTHTADLHKSFVRPFRGAAVDGLYEYLTNNNAKFSNPDSSPQYAKFCSIVQSSGTGKSRLMTELRTKDVILLYMNLRPKDDSGFPERDPVPSAILTEDLGLTSAQYTARCCAFFAALFITLRTDFTASLLTPDGSDITRVVEKWNMYMCDMGSEHRRKFFDRVQAEYQRALSSITAETAKPEGEPSVEDTTDKMGSMTLAGATSKPENPPKPATSEADKSPKSVIGKSDESPNPSKSDKPPELEGGQAMIQEYRAMLRALPQLFGRSMDHPKLVIAFDEAHPLSIMQKHFRPSHILCRVISAYSRLKNQRASVWVVFASTTSKVADFSAPQVIYDSARVAEGGELLFPPYTRLGWDQNADPLDGIAANAVAKFDHIIGFGRPLWSSLKSVEMSDVDGIIAIARFKLCKAAYFNPADTDQALAVLSQRFGLDVCFGHPDSVSYLETAVASHLRICTGTTEDRAWRFTSYPSEPFLSCVAADLLHESPGRLGDTLKTLTRKVDSGMFEIGQSGELASRLLWLLAKDKYVRDKVHSEVAHPYIHQPSAGPWDVELIDCQKVPVIPFLEYLFGDQFSSTISSTAKTAFKDAYINFSHWVSMKQDISPRRKTENVADKDDARKSAEDWTLRHWHRTSAVQCCHGQPHVDKMIPIFFDDPSSGDRDEDRMSQLFISDKAGKKASKAALNVIQRSHSSIECVTKLPYIAVLVDLGVEKPDFSVTFPEKPSQGSDPCLRIYATRGSMVSAPFLTRHPEVAGTLRHLVVRQQSPMYRERFGSYLQDQMEFGSTSLDRHMRWEAGKHVPQ